MKKIIAAFLIIVVVIGIGIIVIQKYRTKQDIMDMQISLVEYKGYDKYGVNYSKDELNSYTFVEELIDKTKLDLITDTQELDLYTASNLEDWEKVKDKLLLCKRIREITYGIRNYKNKVIESYTLGYIDSNNDEVTLTYYSDGTVTKAVYDTSLNQLVVVSNKLRKDIYYRHKKSRC